MYSGRISKLALVLSLSAVMAAQSSVPPNAVGMDRIQAALTAAKIPLQPSQTIAIQNSLLQERYKLSMLTRDGNYQARAQAIRQSAKDEVFSVLTAEQKAELTKVWEQKK